MKKSIIFLAALICLMIQSVTVMARDRYIPAKNLPAAAKTFIPQNFPGQTVSYAKVEKDLNQKTYEVGLDNGVELQFDQTGICDKVNCQAEAVPAHLVPASLANYVNTRYAGSSIVKIDTDGSGYKAELSNAKDPQFNKRVQLVHLNE